MLSDEDKRLWKRATSDVTPINTTPNHLSTPPKKLIPQIQNRPSFNQQILSTPKDRKLFAYDTTLDLHGYSLQQAHKILHDFIIFCYNASKRRLLIITGHGDGQSSIKREFLFWLESESLRSIISSINQAHSKQGGSGAFCITLKKNKS